MLPSNGIIPKIENCIAANKSAHILGYGDICTYLHNIATYESEDSEIVIFNREIDEETLEVLSMIINYGNRGKSPFMKSKIYCCRDIAKRVDLDKLKDDPVLKNIEIYEHGDKDMFHDRFLSVEYSPQTIEIYLMGNSISSFKKRPMNIAQMTGECITHLDLITVQNLQKSLTRIIDESKQIYPKVKQNVN